MLNVIYDGQPLYSFSRLRLADHKGFVAALVQDEFEYILRCLQSACTNDKMMVYVIALARDHDRINFAKSTERLYQCQKQILLCSRASKNIPCTQRKYLNTLIPGAAGEIFEVL